VHGLTLTVLLPEAAHAQGGAPGDTPASGAGGGGSWGGRDRRDDPKRAFEFPIRLVSEMIAYWLVVVYLACFFGFFYTLLCF
jgi:hypothetical protein